MIDRNIIIEPDLVNNKQAALTNTTKAWCTITNYQLVLLIVFIA